ncbi:MAG: MurR/RpiR family transcriptional regulator [Candidatus Binatia bacterium]
MQLLEKLQTHFPALSGNGKKIAEHIVADGTSVSFASLRQLAQMVGVSESSIVRFAQDLGYRGYPELRRQLQQEVKERLSSAARMRETLLKVRGREGLARDLFQKDIELIGETLTDLSHEEFAKAIDLIWKAKRVFIIGLRSPFSLAYFLYFRLVRLQIDARLITVTGSSSLFEQLALLRKQDLLIALGFADIPKETNIAIDHALKVGAKVLGITHPPTSEIGQKAHVVLLAKRGTHRMVQSLTAPFCLLNALAIGVATAKKSKSLQALSQLDRMAAVYWEQSNGKKALGKAKV